jgi:group I intron endonuclease
MNEHYVYVYADPRDGDIFYVGCGKGRRMWVHLRSSLLSKESEKNRILKEILSAGLHPMIVVVDGGLTQEEALSKEREWIRFYGKENLTNLTTGGQGCSMPSPFLGKHHTQEAKERIRQSKLGEHNPMFGKKRTLDALKKFSEKMSGDGHPLWGKHRSESVKEKISSKLKGFQWSDEVCIKRSIGMRRIWAERRRTGKMPKKNRRMLTINGDTKSIDEWVEITGVKKHTFYFRIRKGWKPEDAIRQ